MAVADEREENPYVGPRPFERDERLNFFGRDRELQELLSLVIAHRVVLLYAESGAGKTSLLGAALVPALEQRGFRVLPLARVRGLIEEDASAEHIENIYVFGVLTNWANGVAVRADQPGMAATSLADFLRRHRAARAEKSRPAPLAVVVDQFEELFTLHPERWHERKAFIDQLAEALEQDPLVRVVLSMREDYLAHLDPYASLLPGALRGRFRLERLAREPALRAVTGPLEHSTRSFAPGVAESLVDNLLRVRVDTGRGQITEVVGEFVEPVQLQVACRSLWSKLPPDVVEITEEHRLRFGDVDLVLSTFYDEAIGAAAARARAREDKVRARLEQTLITPMGTRGTMLETEGAAGKIPAAAVAELEDRHLIRAELRAGARWYELTHDRLIEPIRASNRRRFDRARRRRIRVLTALTGGLAILSAALVLGYFLRGHHATPIREQTALFAPNLPITVRGGEANGVDSGEDSSQPSFSPDSRLVLTFLGRRARLSQASNGEQVALLRGHRGHINSGSFSSPDGRLVVTGSDDGTGRVWDALSGKLLAVLRANHPVKTIAVSPHGRFVVTVGEDGPARVWSTSEQKVVAVIPLSGGLDPTAAFSPDGKLLVLSSGDFTATVWRVPSGDKAGALEHEHIVESAAFSPDGTHILTTTYDVATIWNTRTRDVVAELRVDQGITDAAFSRDGKLVVTASFDDTARVWDASTGDNVAVLRGHEAGVNSAAFSPDGKYVVTAGGDGTALWEAETGKLRAVLGRFGGYYSSAAFSPDGRFVSGASGDTEIWRVRQITQLRTPRS
jgi:WD40 repeat protein